MAITTQELYLQLFSAALGGLGDSVGRTTTPITEVQAASFAGDMATEGILWLYNNGIIATSTAVATSQDAGSDPIPSSTTPSRSIFQATTSDA